jgi:uncharacterized protein YciW
MMLLTSVHKKSAAIVKSIYGKDKLTEADRRLAATMAFIRLFSSEDPDFDRRRFYDMCMSGTIAEAT